MSKHLHHARGWGISAQLVLDALCVRPTLRAVGKKFGISGARVKQIADAHGFNWRGPKRFRIPTIRLTEKERFLRTVAQRAGHWIWMGARNRATGMPSFHASAGHRNHGAAQRHAWRLFVGDVPSGQCVIRKCGNTMCVNPGHLFLGSKAQTGHQPDLNERRARGPRRKA